MADGLSPYIDAAPLEEQKYFLATQQVDEARHAVFFKRFMEEVAGIGGTMNEALETIRPQLTWGFVQVFDMLERMSAELRTDRSIPKLAQAITLYHVIIEATLAQPGQHFITSYLDDRDVLPAFREGMHNIAADEQRHIAFGVKMLADLKEMDDEVPAAVADLLREVIPFTAAVLVPPGLGPALRGVLRLHARGDRLRGRDLVRDQDAQRRDAPRRAAGPARFRARHPAGGAGAPGPDAREEPRVRREGRPAPERRGDDVRPLPLREPGPRHHEGARRPACSSGTSPTRTRGT